MPILTGKKITGSIPINKYITNLLFISQSIFIVLSDRSDTITLPFHSLSPYSHWYKCRYTMGSFPCLRITTQLNVRIRVGMIENL